MNFVTKDFGVSAGNQELGEWNNGIGLPGPTDLLPLMDVRVANCGRGKEDPKVSVFLCRLPCLKGGIGRSGRG